MQSNLRECEYINFIVMGADRNVSIIRREFDVFEPLFHWTFLGCSHLPVIFPVACLVYSEGSVPKAYSTEAAVCRNIYTPCLCTQRELLCLWICRKNLALRVAIKIQNEQLFMFLCAPNSESGILANSDELIGTCSCAETPNFICVLGLWCIMTLCDHRWSI